MRPVADQRFENIAESLLMRLSGVQVGASWEADVCRPYSSYARDEQKVPEERDEPLSDNWFTFLLRTGRGVGKTWTENGIGCKKVREGRWKHFAIVGPTQETTRKTQIEHPACGMRAMAAAEGMRMQWRKSLGEIWFPDYGAKGIVASAEKPGALSGPSFDGMLADEIRYWRNPESVWTMVLPGLRLGGNPQIVAGTNPPRLADDPRVRKFLQTLETRPDTFVQTGSSQENLANLSPRYYERVIEPWEGTSLARVEIDGEYSDESEDALWTRAMIEGHRVSAMPTDLVQIVIGVDPHGGADECGIVVCGLGADGTFYVLADLTTTGGAAVWPVIVAEAFEQFKANKIVAEKNYGGDMVAQVIHAAAQNNERQLPVEMVNASRGKYVRAEPASILWQRGRAKIVGCMQKLEDEMVTFVPGSTFSPNRLDAMVWGATSLKFGKRKVGPTWG